MKNIPTAKDKIICSILYTSYFIPLISFVPIAWIIIANIKKIYLKDFIKYHCYQAVLLNMIIVFLPSLFSLIVNFVSNALGLFSIFENSVALLEFLGKNFLEFYSYFIQLLALYAVLWTLRGKYTYIPQISQAVNYLLR
jgi:hypothetical protein